MMENIAELIGMINKPEVRGQRNGVSLLKKSRAFWPVDPTGGSDSYATESA
jgi:hypothetical protein